MVDAVTVTVATAAAAAMVAALVQRLADQVRSVTGSFSCQRRSTDLAPVTAVRMFVHARFQRRKPLASAFIVEPILV